VRDRGGMSVAKLVAISFVVGLVGCAFIWFSPAWTTPAATVEADRHDVLYTSLMLVSALIMGIVVTFLVYMVVKFRRRPGEETLDGPPIHGHTRLEIFWTLVPLAIVIAFAGYGGFVLDRNEAAASDRLIVDVTARQFGWSFGYPQDGVKASEILMLPEGRQAEFHVRSLANDVIHSFYVPNFRIQTNAVPGLVTKTWATPTRIGTYSVICYELCGIGHAQMRAVVRVVEREAFDAWLAEQRGAQAQNPLGNIQDTPLEGGQ
jgi:cytochrome c oxidase subunit 2